MEKADSIYMAKEKKDFLLVRALKGLTNMEIDIFEKVIIRM